MEDDWRCKAQFPSLPSGSAFAEVLDVAVPLGFVFRDTSQLKWQLWWMFFCAQQVQKSLQVSGVVLGEDAKIVM